MTREEAKRILYIYHAMLLIDVSHREAFDMAIKALDQEPKTGHWIEQIDHEENCRTLICSNCDRPALHDGDSIWKHKFCPHCGAKMIEPQESEGGMSEISEVEIQTMSKEQNYLRGYSDGKLDTLDKIRAEIKAMSGDIETIADVLQIIDKYKAERNV